MRIIRDTLIITGRNLRLMTRRPQVLIFSTFQPIMLVLLFNYVFGGAIGQAIHQPGISYIDFLLPGVIIQATAFGTTTTAVGMAADLNRGIIDRFRSLPMSRSAVLVGRSLADTVRISFVIVLMTLVGLLLGFDFHQGIGDAALAYVIAISFGLSFSMIGAWIGMTVKNEEAAQAAGFIWLFPLIFTSSAFVPLATFPHWLQTFAKINPITHYVDAMRHLVLGIPANTLVIPTAHPVAAAFLWTAGILLVFTPLAVLQYRRRQT